MKTTLLTLLCLSLIAASPVHATIVQTVDQPVTEETKTWSHSVEEAGDYQIGLAWIEAIEGKRNVTVEILKNGKPIKTLRAPVGQVTRFATRIENLTVNDQITVTVVPNGSSYRGGYQIAFGTPTFKGLKVFKVANYGAKGDGKTDDMGAIHATLDAAKAAGGGIVRFDGSKTYRVVGLRDFTEESVLDLKGAQNIKVEGNGAKILLHPPDGFAMVSEAENIQIDGFTIYYDPRPYYQGMIKKIDVEAMTVEIDVPERYPVPEIGKNTFRGPFFGRSFIPDAPGSRSGHGNNIYVEEVTRIGNDRQLRLHIRKEAKGSDNPNTGMKPRLQYAHDQDATEFVIPHVKYAHRGGFTRITHSSRVKFSNLRYYGVPHFWLAITHNTGPITLSDVDLQTPNPETELFVSWRDGMHIKNGRWGILIEDGDWDGAAMYDDTFAIYSRAQRAVAVSGNTITLTPTFLHKEVFLWQQGDWASVWTPGQEQLRGMARVVSVEGKTGNNTFHVTLESMPTGSTAGDIVLHEESLNRGSVVRNCQTTKVGTEYSSTRFRCVDVRFENNMFKDFHFWFHAGSNGPRPRDIVLDRNIITDPQGSSLNLDQGRRCTLQGNTLDGVTIKCNRCQAIYLDGNTFTNMTREILNLKDTEAWLFGTTKVNGHKNRLSDQVKASDTSAVHFRNPKENP
jgi:hypothetical protein